MTSLSTPSLAPAPISHLPRRLLSGAGTVWFLAALIGQGIFAAYIFAVYVRSAAAGQWDSWNETLFTGLIRGDLAGNTMMIVHLLLAFVITASGPMQLIPALRRRLPAFHRWNGRLYILVAILISLAGIGIGIVRPFFGGPINGVLQSFNGVVIITCAILALKAARARNFSVHRRWATRLFLAASGVWFLRVMMIAWGMTTGGAGLGEELDGPMGRAALLGQTVIPLAVYQLYLTAEEHGAPQAKVAMAVLLFLLTLIMIGGIIGATFGMWLPRMTS
ncbi:MAG: DUF2306 domain-containing protein [Hyphomonas sp.]